MPFKSTDLSDTFKETGKGIDEACEFPFSITNPILIIGMLKGNKGIFKKQVFRQYSFREVLAEAQKQCELGTIEFVGIVGGQYATVCYELNYNYYVQRYSEHDSKPHAKKKIVTKKPTNCIIGVMANEPQS